MKTFTLFSSRLVLISTLFFVLASGCKKEESLQITNNYDQYFPINSEQSIVYKVDSITWNDFFSPVKIDTFQYFIKFQIGEKFTDEEGRESYYYRKFYRTDTTSWVFKKNFAITKTAARVELLEENIRFIKMVFPINNSIQWDMNAMNILSATSSYYSEFDEPMSLNNYNFDSTLTIIHQDLETLIGKDYHKEVYSKHTGLIFQEVVDIEKNTNGSWKKGYKYIYSILSIEP
ncbi:MAG: hypothetical protein JXR34_12715 [Bacteroidales bacterium]|nr:hypothetical protein [Bacteroidales bacterium]